MMNKKLAKVLIEKGLITEGMEITAKFKTPGIDGMPTSYAREIFTLNGFVMRNGSYYFDLISTEDGQRMGLRTDTVIEIDGMCPIRFAASYDIDANGDPIVYTTKKRGRKSKAELALLNG